jgi:alkylation response protein AidB-like acyl-CoA dehydrogenase
VSAAQTQARAPVIASHDAAVALARAFGLQISEGVHERDRDGSLPVEELAELDRGGLLRITVPRRHGGSGLGCVTLAEVPRSIAASPAHRKYDLDRHWRNARTHASHDPVDWKYHHVGNFLLNGVFPPNHGQL